MNIKASRLFNLILVSMILLATACASDSSSSSSSAEGSSNSGKKEFKDEVVVHQLSDPTGLHPTNTSDAGATRIKRHLYQRLLEYGKDLELVPLLASELPTVEKTPEGGMIMEYKLRKDATWDDGKPITAEDVVFSYKCILNPKVDAANVRPYFEFITDMKTYPDDPYRVTMYSDELNFLWDHFTGTDVVIFPKHKYDPTGETDKFTYKQIASGDKSVVNSPENIKFAERFNDIKYQREEFHGSGPYEFVEWKTDQNVVVKRKENWWGDKYDGTNMYLSKGPAVVKFQTVNDRTTALTATKGGELDVIGPVRARDWAEDIPKSQKLTDNFNKFMPPYLYYSFIGMNIRDPKLSDKRVRKALAHLVDVDLIKETLLYGLAERVVGPVHPTSSDYNSELVPYAYSIDEAKKLLTEAGWVDTDGNGIVDKVINGKKTDFKIEFNYNQGNDTRKNVGLTMKESARQAGVELDVIPLEWSVMSERLQSNQLKMWYGAWVFDPRPHAPKQIWHTSSYGGGSNYTGFGNAETDKMIEDISQELDPEKRKKLYYKWQEILHDEVPYIFLYTGNNLLLVHNRFDKESVNSTARNPGYNTLSFQLAPGFSTSAN